MKIDVTYDLVCPWCYLALASLQEAVAQRTDVEVRLWPYQLTPAIPPGGVDHAAFFGAKVGEAQAKERYRQMEALAAQAGVPLNYSTIRLLPNTLVAHQGVQFAQGFGKGLPILNLLMRAHFTGANIGTVDGVVAVAQSEGLDGVQLRAYLADGASERSIQQLKTRALEHGVKGVPNFEIDGVPLPGGRTVEQWLEVLSLSTI